MARVALFSAALPGWDAERVLRAAGRLRVSLVEWGAGPDEAIRSPLAGRRVRKLCDAAGIRVCGLSVQDPRVSLATPERAARYMKLAIDLGAPQVRFFAQPYLGGRLTREERAAREGLARLVERALPAGITVLVETSPTTLAPSPDAVLALLDGHPPERVGALYDPGNMVIEGHVAPALAVARLGPYLRHVHVKNIAWELRDGVWRWRLASLATGLLEWREIVSVLAGAGYRGCFAIDHPHRSTLATLRSEAGFLTDLVESSGR